MSTFKDVVVCKYAGCNQVYNDARFLPCGKRTCAAHIEEMLLKCNDVNNSERKMIKCHFCEEMHSFPENGKGFPVDENIPLLLSIKYGKEPSAAKKNFNEVAQLIDKLTKIDQESFVIDYFERVEADIVLEKEFNLQNLAAYYQQLVEEVHVRKVKCLNHLKTSKTVVSELEAIKQTLVEHENKLKSKNLDFMLKTLDGNEDEWKAIQTECAALLEKVRSLEKELKERIIGDQITDFKPSTHLIPIDSICGNLDQATIDSTILTSRKMKNDLVELCKLSGKQFTAIYRATTDGFHVSGFHAKCDSKPATLTVIKTTNGCVFGGYTALGWDSSSGWRADPHAFLFSLVNVRCAPRLMPVVLGDQYSIYCNASNGPIFGAGNSIHIVNNSNTSTKSNSNLGESYDFTLYSYGTIEAQSFLAGSHHFQTSEIEVFQLS